MDTFSGRFTGFLPAKRGRKLRRIEKRFRVRAKDQLKAMDRVANTIPQYKLMVFKTFRFDCGRDA